MSLRVLKFGGTSVETPERILAVARRIQAARAAGDQVVAVVSAMGQTTDELLRLAHRVSRTPHGRELDMLLTSGERIAMALVAMALESLGCPAISFTGSQSGIITDERHFDARIRTIRPGRIVKELAEEKVVIVAGFQGVSAAKEITTLGRGGSDTTAVAMAVRFGAARCEILTDVAGVLSADPRVVSAARKLERIDHATMIVLSHLGGRVLYRRAAIVARRFGLPLEVRCSYDDAPGTMVGADEAPLRPFSEETVSMEEDRFLAVALESPVRWVRRTGAGGASGATSAVSRARVAAPSFFYVFSERPEGGWLEEWVEPPDGDTAVDGGMALNAGNDIRTEIRTVALVSLVGEGLVTQRETILAVRGCLEAAGIPVLALHASSLSISMVTAEEDGERASRALHARFF